MGYFFCNFCPTSFSTWRNYRKHCIINRHMTAKQLERVDRLRRCVVVTRFLPYMLENIIEFFGEHGTIVSYEFKPRSIFIEFDKSDVVDFLMQNTVYYNQRELHIQRKIFAHSPPAQISLKNSLASICSIEEKLNLEKKSVSSPEIYLQKFLSHVQYDEATVQKQCNEICEQLEKIFQPIFPYGQAVPYGSSQTGLHMKDSDFDIFFDIGERMYNDTQWQNKSRKSRKHRWTLRTVFQQIKTELYKNNSKFSHIIPIISAKVPVIRFCYNPLDTKCDIILTEKLGLVNTRLMKHYIKIDHTIKSMMLILKCWMKSLGLYGTNKIVNISLFMMLIFYLQQPHLHLVPTVQSLQLSCENKQYKNNWQINFDERIKHYICRPLSSIPELIQGFFSFYADFDFYDKVICPYDGIMKAKGSLNNIRTAFDLYKPVWIQSPFQHTLNIADNVSKRLINDFQRYCRNSAAACTRVTEDQLKNLLLFVLDPFLKFHLGYAASIQAEISSVKYKKWKLVANNYLDNGRKDTKSDWFYMFCKIIEKIFTDVFKVKIEEQKCNTELMTIEANDYTRTKLVDKVFFTLESTCNVTYKNRRVKVPINQNLSPIEREIELSNQIVSILKEKQKTILLKFLCVLEKEENRAVITLYQTYSLRKQVHRVAKFMQELIPQLVEEELQYAYNSKKPNAKQIEIKGLGMVKVS